MIQGRYQLREKIGAGGMGVVHAAYDRLTGQLVALKQLTAVADIDQEARLTLAREFRVLASLRHPHLISVIDYGFDLEGRPFFTMELLPNAQTIVDAGRSAPLDEQMRLILEMLEGLAYVHRRGLIHRDVKPSNMLVGMDGRVKVLDFGLVQEGPPNAESGIMGTINYIAPETLLGRAVTAAADLYSVGVIACEMLTGSHPFPADNVAHMIDQILMRPPSVGLENVRLAAVIERLLHKEPLERYASAPEVITALREAVDNPAPPEDPHIRESYLQASAFLGRDAEMARLLAALDEGGMILVGGEGGVGKSRLLDELRIQGLVRGLIVVRGQTDMQIPDRMWREPVRRLALDVYLNETQVGILRELVPDLHELLGFADTRVPALQGTAARQRLALTLRELLTAATSAAAPQRRASAARGLLLLEDLHWDALDILALLAPAAAAMGWLIVATFRDDETPDLPQSFPDAAVIKLTRFQEPVVAALSAAMLGEAGRRPDVIDLLQRETEGNAFFMVEVLRALAEEAGALDAIGRVTLPATMTVHGVFQVLQRRLARVAAEDQAALKLAAVMGREIDPDIMRVSETWLTRCANAAVLELIDGYWRFSHDTLRATLLATLSMTERRDLHRAAATAISAAYADDPRYAETLADHWFTAGDMPQATAAALRAADRMVNYTADYAKAQYLIARVLPFAEGETRAELLIVLSSAQRFVAGYVVALATLKEAMLLARSDVLRLRALGKLAQMHVLNKDYDDAIRFTEQAMALAIELNDRAAESSAWSVMGIAYFGRGGTEESYRCMALALTAARASGDVRLLSNQLNNLGLAETTRGNYADARAYLSEAQELTARVGDRMGASKVALNLGRLLLDTGDYAGAAQALERLLEQVRGLTVRETTIDAYHMLAQAAYVLGDEAQAVQHLATSLEQAEAYGDVLSIGEAQLTNAHIHIDCARYEAASAALEIAVGVGRRLENPPLLISALVAQALVEDLTAAAARAHYDEARATMHEIYSPNYRLRLLPLVPLVLRHEGNAAARALLLELLPVATQNATAPTLLELLQAAAHITAADGDAAHAAYLVAVVRQHPACGAMRLPMLARLAATLPAAPDPLPQPPDLLAIAQQLETRLAAAAL